MNTKTFTPKSTMKIYTCLCLLFLAGYLVAQNNTSALLPMPNQITSVKGKPFTVRSGKTAIYLSQPELQFTANTLQNILSDRMQVEIPLASESDRADIRLLIDPAMEGNEHYRIEITSKRITISGATVRAVYYGVMTMDQLLLGDVCATTQKKISPVYVDDAPRFSHRALMLDPARHFLPVNDVKFFIDQMAHYKYNILQLHLTDDQGWRVEIKKHPKILVGYSDITVLLQAIYKKTGLVTFSGPDFISFGTEYAEEQYQVFEDAFVNKKLDKFNNGKKNVIKKENAEGKIIGTNLGCMMYLLGTEYLPDMQDNILFIESYKTSPNECQRRFAHLKQYGIFDKIKGIVVGYNYDLQKDGNTYPQMEDILLEYSKKYNFPIVKCNDFGHKIVNSVIPIGGFCKIDCENEKVEIIEKFLK